MKSEYEPKGKGSFPPWSRIPSLKEMTEEAGIDCDQFIEWIGGGKTADEIAHLTNISPEVSRALYGHFMHYGISSVMGGD